MPIDNDELIPEKTTQVFDSIEVDMLGAAGKAAKNADLSSPTSGMPSLGAELNKIAADSEPAIRTAVNYDMLDSLISSAIDDMVFNPRSAPAEVERAKEVAISAADSVFPELRTAASTMASSTNSLYYQELLRAASEERSGLKTRDESIRDAVVRMAERGVTYAEYADKNGRVYRVPVDVGVRSAVRTNAARMMRDETIARAERLGYNLVEVSSHIGARPSHAVWQGAVYQLNGDDEYPNYYENCLPGDMVDGIGGYNCYHHVRIFHGERRWKDDPCAGTGYTNDEAYAIRQKQRSYENSIRHLQRVKEVLKMNDLDTRDINKRIRAYSQKLDELISDNKEILKREKWRESIYSRARSTSSLAGTVYLSDAELAKYGLVSKNGIIIRGKSELTA